jgi:organic radical activating enzyme
MIYTVVEVFYSIQGEGLRTGTPNVFVRFAGCNLTCNWAENGFDCDTNFSSGRRYTARELLTEMSRVGGSCRNVVLTGGEPALQISDELIRLMKDEGWFIAIETNGTRPLPDAIDFVCVSPKTAEHTLQVKLADEVKYVLSDGQALPQPRVKAGAYLVSPAFQADGGLRRKDLEWCLATCKENPQWRLSLQIHKFLNIR